MMLRGYRLQCFNIAHCIKYILGVITIVVQHTPSSDFDSSSATVHADARVQSRRNTWRRKKRAENKDNSLDI